ncbi:MAG: ATP-dependent zinc metalloprotease FtsH [Clostridia bacterium]|nr:ATP-dependent zinc metalloprotease FtsH [Clostridia bacterium]
MKKSFKGIGVWIAVLLIFYASYAFLGDLISGVEHISYSELVKEIKNENVKEMRVLEKSADIVLKNDERCTVDLPSRAVMHEDLSAEITDQMAEGKLKYIVEKEGISFMSILSIGVSVVMLILVLSLVLGGGMRGANNFAKSKAKLFDVSKKKVTFRDVAGAKEEKEEMQEIVEFLKAPDKFIKLGARIPKGVLLVGPPGTGKTLLARAVAGEAGVPFFSISGSDFVEMYVGVGASRVRDLFENAKKAKPCIIFIDEIDAVGRRRGSGMGGGHDEREQTLNQLLVEMDGFGKNEEIIIIAATNRPDILDPALLRPGRFDRQITVDLPDVGEREEILNIYAKQKPVADNVDLKLIAKNTSGLSGAELENIMNEAAILAARDSRELITNDDISNANVKVLMGPEKRSRIIPEKDKKITAYHEAGHALVAKFSTDREKVSHISIIPRGNSGGHTMYHSKEDNTHMTRGDLLASICSTLGGRAAEAIVFDDITTGASADIKQATRMANAMVTKFGMSDKLGLVCYDQEEEVVLGRDLGVSKSYSDKTAGDIDFEIKSIIENEYKKAVEILKEHREKLDRVADALLEKETIDGKEFEEIINS